MTEHQPTVEEIVFFLIREAYKTNEENGGIIKARHKEEKRKRIVEGKETHLSDLLYAAEAGMVVDNHKKLQLYFIAALDIAQKFDLGTKAVNKILREYAKKLQETSWIIRSPELPSHDTIVGFIKLGASSQEIELILGERLKAGYPRQSLELAGILRRQLTREEIQVLVNKYNEGASRSNDQERVLKNLAFDCLTEEEAREIIEAITESRHEFDHAID